MSWKIMAIKIGRKLVKLLRKEAWRAREDAVAKINKNRRARDEDA